MDVANHRSSAAGHSNSQTLTSRRRGRAGAGLEQGRVTRTSAGRGTGQGSRGTSRPFEARRQDEQLPRARAVSSRVERAALSQVSKERYPEARIPLLGQQSPELGVKKSAQHVANWSAGGKRVAVSAFDRQPGTSRRHVQTCSTRATHVQP